MIILGQAFCKEEIIQLAEDMIQNTEYETSMADFCNKILIVKNNKKILGETWYNNFLKRHESELKRARCLIQDSKRRTRCTYEHFENMYNSVYDSMVECGVAVKLEEETMFDIDGNETLDPLKMYG
jgi:hypothetical protein